MSPERSLLVIEGDANVRRGAEFALLGLGSIQLAGTADEALTALRSGRPFSVVITTLSLPGAKDSEVCASSAELHPDSVRILMVGRESMRCVSHAINQSGVFRMLVRPFTGATLRSAASEALDEHARLARERRTLEGTMHGSLEAIAAMLAVVHPAAFGRATRLRRIATLLAERIGLPGTWEIQVAALLSQFGMLSLPAELVDRLCRNRSITDAERQQLRAATEATLHVLESIPRMDRVCEILRAIDLLPSRQSGRAGVAGDAERVLTLAIEFDGLFAEHGSASEALRVMESHIGRYFTPWFDVLREVVGAPNAVLLIDVPLADVRPGQFFAADVRSPSDLLLVARGQPVTQPLLFKIRNDWCGFAAVTMVRMVQPPERPKDETLLTDGSEGHRAA